MENGAGTYVQVEHRAEEEAWRVEFLLDCEPEVPLPERVVHEFVGLACRSALPRPTQPHGGHVKNTPRRRPSAGAKAKTTTTPKTTPETETRTRTRMRTRTRTDRARVEGAFAGDVARAVDLDDELVGDGVAEAGRAARHGGRGELGGERRPRSSKERKQERAQRRRHSAQGEAQAQARVYVRTLVL